MIKITDEEAESLAEYLWLTLIPYIQDAENEVDNLVYVRNLANVWYKCDKQRDKRIRECKDADSD